MADSALNERLVALIERSMSVTKRILQSGSVWLLVGTLAGLAAIALVFSPVIPGPVQSVTSLLATPLLIFWLAVLVALVSLIATYRSSAETERPLPFETPPEQPTFTRYAQTGSEVDEPFDELTDIDTVLTHYEEEYMKRRITLELREAAVDVLTEAENLSAQKARNRILDGSWTDNQRVASFLGDGVTKPSVGVRIRDWFSGDLFERRVRETVDVLLEKAALSRAPVDTDSTERTETDFERGGGVEAGNVQVTDASHRQSATITASDAETESSGRWQLSVSASFVLAAVGLLTGTTALTLGAVVACTYAVYGYLTRPPEMTLTVTRAVSDISPVPGEHVEVVVTVENVGDHPIGEVRFIDGVPDDVPISAGSPRGIGSLKPGETATATYEIESQRGKHAFEPMRVWTRNASGDIERTTSLELSVELTCRDPLEVLTMTGETTPYTGRIPTDTGGQGVEFYATREYQSSDPMKQIDWNFWARTGEPRTIEFKQTRAASVVILLDDRKEMEQSRHDWSPDAVTLGQFAAVTIADQLLADSNSVGAATLGGQLYLPPSRGRDQRFRIDDLFERSIATRDQDDEPTHDVSPTDTPSPYNTNAGSSSPGRSPLSVVRDGGVPIAWLRKRLPQDAQVLFVTPMLDNVPSAIARRLGAEGNDVTIVSPDVTTTEKPGSAIEHIERRERLRELRSEHVRVADWPTERPLSIALERAQVRWST